MRHDCSRLLPVEVVLVDLALIDLTLPYGEAFPVGIGEAIHAVHALHPFDVTLSLIHI